MDLIEREKVKVAIREKFKTLQERTEINMVINEQPTVDAVPVMHGHWDCRNPQDHWEYRKYSCSNCGAGGYQTRYCSACGAMMDEDGGEQDGKQ